MTTMIDKDFYGPGTKLGPNDLAEAAASINVECAVLAAIVHQESHEEAFLPDGTGRPTILFEPYIFHRLTGGKYDKNFPALSVDNQKDSHYGATGEHQYVRLEAATSLNTEAALKSTSWGFWQCMGFNYAEAGFPDVLSMIKGFILSERSQLTAFVHFLKVSGLVPTLQKKDWAAIARHFNGPDYAENHYDTDLAAYYKAHSNGVVAEGSTGPLVEAVQKALNVSEVPTPPVKADGVFGPQTVDAVKTYQEAKGLIPDGVVGASTLSTLVVDKTNVVPPLKSKQAIGAAIGGVTAIGGASAALSNWTAFNTAVGMANAVGKSSQGREALAQIVHAGDVAHLLIGAMALTIIGLGAYVIWTKFTDYKKITGGGSSGSSDGR